MADQPPGWPTICAPRTAPDTIIMTLQKGGMIFCTLLPTPQAALLHEFLALQGILTRLFEAPLSLRFGLPPDEAGWQRLQQALAAFSGDIA